MEENQMKKYWGGGKKRHDLQITGVWANSQRHHHMLP